MRRVGDEGVFVMHFGTRGMIRAPKVGRVSLACPGVRGDLSGIIHGVLR